MPSNKLHNYIRSHRKQNGLSQDEIAFLLDSKDGAKISRYEHFAQEPGLETGIGLGILFHTPVRTLFGGVSQRVERKILKRAKILLEKLQSEGEKRSTTWKRNFLEQLCTELNERLGT